MTPGPTSLAGGLEGCLRVSQDPAGWRSEGAPAIDWRRNAFVAQNPASPEISRRTFPSALVATGCEIRRADNESTLHQAAQLQFLEQESGHDRFTGPGVVEQESHPWQLEHVVVDSFELVW